MASRSLAERASVSQAGRVSSLIPPKGTLLHNGKQATSHPSRSIALTVRVDAAQQILLQAHCVKGRRDLDFL